MAFLRYNSPKRMGGAPMKDGKKYILVADDDREIRQIVSLLLSSEGYAVLTAEDGIQAARLASGEVDLYLLDVNMPGQSGILAAPTEKPMTLSDSLE